MRRENGHRQKHEYRREFQPNSDFTNIQNKFEAFVEGPNSEAFSEVRIDDLFLRHR